MKNYPSSLPLLFPFPLNLTNLYHLSAVMI